MAERTFKLIRVRYPLAAICESCQKVFTSRVENADLADKEIRADFDAHRCVFDAPTSEPESFIKAAGRIVKDVTEE
jgi:hypothetical protein